MPERDTHDEQDEKCKPKRDDVDDEMDEEASGHDVVDVTPDEPSSWFGSSIDKVAHGPTESCLRALPLRSRATGTRTVETQSTQPLRR